MNEHLYKKVITALNCCAADGKSCSGCPYKKTKYTCKHLRLKQDVLALLTEMHEVVSLKSRFPIPGKIDKKGNQICNGDILHFEDEECGEEYLLVYYHEPLASFMCESDRASTPVDLETTKDLEIIGNRFDKPELLELFKGACWYE